MKALNVFSMSKVASKLTGRALMVLACGVSMSAQAILPTPEPELDNPTSASNAQMVEDGTRSEAANVSTKTVAALVSTDAQGNPTLMPIDSSTRLRQGNVIEYHTYITNTSADRMRSMTVTMSIPDQVKLLGDISPKNAFASIDGNTFSRTPLRTRINGQVQDLPLEYYKHLRWTLEGLGINETAVVKYRTVVR